MSNILYCVIHTQHQDDRADNIISTWGKDKDLLFYSDHDDIKNNVYKVCDSSDYSSGQIKAIKVFDLLNNKFDKYDWYFFCDNDTFVNTKKLEEYVKNADNKYVHGQIINCWPVDRTLYYPSGGAGYLLSNNILKQLSKAVFNQTIYGDVSVGINIRNMNIKIHNSDLFHSQNQKYYNIADENIKDNITFHYIKTYDDMTNLYNLCY